MFTGKAVACKNADVLPTLEIAQMSKSHAETVDLMPVFSEKLSAEAFRRLIIESPSMVKSSRIIPPTLGGKGFGSFEVVYSRPIYKAGVGDKPKSR